MPTELCGTIVNNQDAPLASTTITLIGAGTPLTQVTDAQGKFRFPNLSPGTYTLSSVLYGYRPNLRSDITISADKETKTKIILNEEETSASSSSQRDGNSSSLSLKALLSSLMRKSTTLMPTVILSGIAVLFAYFMFKGTNGVSAIDLGDDKVARGVITYLISLGTITIAMVLVLGVILGGEGIKERFTQGKEILTLLIGVLGTIIGFYYGSTLKEVKAEPAAIQMGTVTVDPNPSKAGASVRLTTLVAGGVPPYTYSISFDKDSAGKDPIPPIVDQTSSDGNISQGISIPAEVTAEAISFQVTVKDKNGTTYTYNKNSQQKINLKE